MRAAPLLFTLFLGCAPATPPSATEGQPAHCARQDAQDDGTDCLSVIGYAWDGRACAPVVCGCAGRDCANIATTEQVCEQRFESCH